MPKFIGGSADGKFYEWNKNSISIPRLSKSFFSFNRSSMEPVELDREQYKRIKIMGQTRVFEVFVPDHWDGDRLIEELINRA